LWEALRSLSFSFAGREVARLGCPGVFLSIYNRYVGFLNIFSFFLSFVVKLINASRSGGNVTLWMTVVMDLMNQTIAVSTLTNAGI
jgi:hypothetical protein